MVPTQRLEASVVQSVLTQISNLGWLVDEKDPKCNVTQQRVKTQAQAKKLKGQRPDFVLYQKDTSRPIGIIEAKRPGQPLEKALDDAEEKYAKPLNAPLIFAYNDTFVHTRYLHNGRPLRIDGEEVRQFVDHYTALQFVEQGPEILSVPEHIKFSREQLITIFKRASNLLREAGLQAGLERFGVFSDILFLKIMDEVSALRIHAGEEPPISAHLRWSEFYNKPPVELHQYLSEVVWPQMNQYHKGIFGETLPVQSPEILAEIIRELSRPGLNLTASDTDVKGDAFEYYLKNAYQGLSIKDLGEYFTPRNIVKTMVSMVDPQIGEKIYDPFCGTGGFLIESFKYLRLRTKDRARWDSVLRNETVYGSEITSNARIAKMNMILFGDGHSNIWQEDSLANPKRGTFDIVLTNPPYSQSTRYGDLYDIPGNNADPVCVSHCIDALQEGGRAAFLVKEDFLTEGGRSRVVRERIMREAKDFTVISLPRGLFEPYTPTKTSIIYFEKSGRRTSTYFYVINHVGHTFGARKKQTNRNDLPVVLYAFNDKRTTQEIDSIVVDNKNIEASNYSLWVYDYIEKLPDLPYPLAPLSNFIEQSGQTVSPQDHPGDEFVILGVTNQHGVGRQYGIYENDTKLGADIKQKYIRVRAGDLVYNPHRVNVGSIGIVTDEHDGKYVSPIYVVFRTVSDKMPATLIWSLLKSNMYKNIIRAYDTRNGAVRPNLTWDQLIRIKVPDLPIHAMEKFIIKHDDWNSQFAVLEEAEKELFGFLDKL